MRRNNEHPHTKEKIMPHWNPSDWIYHAEGGKHAIFRCKRGHQEGEIHFEQFCGYILRIRKVDLAHASFQYRHQNGRENAVSEEGTTTKQSSEELAESDSHKFQRLVVQPMIGRCYIDLPETVVLPNSFCAQIFDSTISSKKIPESRLPSWKLKTRDKPMQITHDGVIAYLLRDHTNLLPHPRLPTDPTTTLAVMSVEIKPKAGYITTSPLVLPENRCKYYRTRYSLQQELMQRGIVRKGWTKDMESSGRFIGSKYSPLDLFSGCRQRIYKALKELSNNMQNNFRVYCNGKQVFGEYKQPSNHESSVILGMVLRDFATNSSSSEWDSSARLLDFITTILANILERENLLTNVQRVQLLDVIDGDGAVKIYQRLVNLCMGSQSDADAILDEESLCVGEVTRSGVRDGDRLLASSPYDMPNCVHLSNFLDKAQRCRAYFREKERDCCINLDHVFINECYESCNEFIDKMSKDACIFLLKNWLISLALCDISFFVTFQLISGVHTASEEMQNDDHGGVVVCALEHAKHSEYAVLYEVKVVDCDPKPASKLRNRAAAEGFFKNISCPP
ncbi:hypothetical protein ACHAXS_012240 [Conticribra weissflogii]